MGQFEWCQVLRSSVGKHGYMQLEGRKSRGYFKIHDYSPVVCSECLKERDYSGNKKHCNARLQRDLVSCICPGRSTASASQPQPTE